MLLMLVAGCSAAPRGRAPEGCSGVPGDQRLPATDTQLSLATHGPDGTGKPVPLVATARPFSASQIPLLYVYDDQARQVLVGNGIGKLLTDPAFLQVQKEAYWGDVNNGRYNEVPWLDKCSQSSIVDGRLDFHAPAGGLLFVQFLAPHCAECDRLTKAITGVVSKYPKMNIRWITVAIPPSVGKLTGETKVLFDAVIAG